MRKLQISGTKVLSPIKMTFSLATSGSLEFSVPAGKRWNFRAASLTRDYTGSVSLFLQDIQASPSQIQLIQVATSVYELYQPLDRLTIPAGWKIIGIFGAGTYGALRLQILIEEENEY